MIVIKNLKKSFKKRSYKSDKKYVTINAISDINLKINKGEILGLIGPNGAGKTTTIKIISTLILPDKGSVTVDGHNIIEEPGIIKNKVGVLPGEFSRSIYWRLSGMHNMRFFAKLRGIKKPDERINELLRKFDLEQHKKEQIMKYSTGMKHKLAFAISLLNDPPILLLDEPLTGIDPVTTYEIKNLIKNEFQDKTIIWTSHNLYEIEEMCDKIALINNGKIILKGKPENLKKDYWNYTKVKIVSDKPQMFKDFDAEIKKDSAEIKTDNVSETLYQITDFAKQKNIKIIDIKTLKPTLEEIFMESVKNV